MKVAEVTYSGTMRSHNRVGRDGNIYNFKNPMGGEPRSTPVENIHDALEMEKQDVFDVDWTVQGEVLKRVGGQISNTKEALSSLSYRQKQKLISVLGLNVRGNSPEEELEEALEPVVEEMIAQREMSN